MAHENQEPEYHNNILGVIAGILVGSLAGALTMLLLAPQPGKRTRMQIQVKGMELRDRTSEIMEDAMAQMRLDRKKIITGGRRKVKDLLQQGQTLVVEQLEHVSEVAQAGKKAILSS